jgi:hypothetical protein
MRKRSPPQPCGRHYSSSCWTGSEGNSMSCWSGSLMLRPIVTGMFVEHRSARSRRRAVHRRYAGARYRPAQPGIPFLASGIGCRRGIRALADPGAGSRRQPALREILPGRPGRSNRPQPFGKEPSAASTVRKWPRSRSGPQPFVRSRPR